jgi:hypothetical protein
MILIHTVQLILAIIILGLSAYEVHYVAYNVLIYSVIVVSSSQQSPSLSQLTDL